MSKPRAQKIEASRIIGYRGTKQVRNKLCWMCGVSFSGTAAIIGARRIAGPCCVVVAEASAKTKEVL